MRVFSGDGGIQTALHEISAALVLGVPERPVKPSVIMPTTKRNNKNRLCGTNHSFSIIMQFLSTFSELNVPSTGA